MLIVRTSNLVSMARELTKGGTMRIKQEIIMNSFDERLNQLNKEGFGDSIQEARLFSGR
jgi:hypothetical protein